MSSKTQAMGFVKKACIFAALGGLLFGLDQGFINGSLDFIEKDFGWTTLQGETFAGIMVYGCIFGVIISGWVARTIGRKKTLVLAALFFTVFAFWGSITSSVYILFGTRFCIGLAVGCASFCVPLYLSEIAPTKLRGGFIAMYQFAITIGIFLIYVSNSVIAHYFESWRLMLGIIAIPSIVMLVGVLTVPRSPRWLMLKGKKDEAESVLKKTRETEEEINSEITEIENSLKVQEGKKASIIDVITKPIFLKVMVVGVLLQLLQQLSGINTVIYYSTNIFNSAGFNNAAVATIVIGLVNMLSTIIAIKFVDKWGRKPICYTGLVIMIITLALNGIIFKVKEVGIEKRKAEFVTLAVEKLSNKEDIKTEMAYNDAKQYLKNHSPSDNDRQKFYNNLIQLGFSKTEAKVASNDFGYVLPGSAGWMVLLSTVIYIIAFAFSLGPIIWIFCAEMFPLEVRDVGVTITTIANWVGCAIVVQCSMSVMKVFGGSDLFFAFGVCCLLGIFLLAGWVPETKGISLEEIELNLKNGKKLRRLGDPVE